MADVNEEIVAQYLKLVRKWFCVSDISFVVPGNYSNIDLLGFDPSTGRYYDIEVKYRSAYSISATNRKGKDTSKEAVEWLIEGFTSYKGREQAVRKFTNNRPSTKILVTTRRLLGKRDGKRQKLESAFKRGLARAGFRRSEV